MGREAEHEMTRKQHRRAMRVCIRCGDGAVGIYCDLHREQTNAQKLAWHHAHPERRAKLAAIRRDALRRLRDEGKCIACTRLSPTYRCLECSRDKNQRSRERRKAKELREGK